MTTAPHANDAGSTPRSQTAVAGREFLHALASDAAKLARRLRFSVRTSASQPVARNYGVLRIARRIALLLIVALLIFSGTMLWVLYDVPLNNRITEGHEREIVLEAANGAQLGR